MLPSIPKTMKSVILSAFNEPISVQEIPVPTPSSGQVLVKMEASPINPSDLLYLSGTSHIIYFLFIY